MADRRRRPPPRQMPRPRSRSDRGAEWSRSSWDTTSWISRNLCGLARYPHKRPRGLQVDSSGQLSLKNLMEVWGYDQGLQVKDVLEAVHAHRYQDEDEHTLRYELNTDQAGNMLIKVHPKRDRWAKTRKRREPSVTDDEEEEEESAVKEALVKDEPSADSWQEEEGDGAHASTWAKQEPSDAEEVPAGRQRRGFQRQPRQGASWSRRSSHRRR
eukprot:TRINITY_DN106842_c0_g1_i1.p1 TRINITY_DN106842_c0_g1~~TRINITY_DN106842_c0_g1_i1.p1  ORF type:complete len:213 (+),score=29.68 TRINITY_DN106842_c0_g1_i1:113-751(+)